jgi:hypothetical protein
MIGIIQVKFILWQVITFMVIKISSVLLAAGFSELYSKKRGIVHQLVLSKTFTGLFILPLRGMLTDL